LALAASVLLIVIVVASTYLRVVFYQNGGRWPAI